MQRNSERKPTTMSKKMEFDNEQLYNYAQETTGARQIKLVYENIDALKLFTLVAQVKYILI